MKTIEESIQQYFANTLTSALLLEMVQEQFDDHVEASKTLKEQEDAEIREMLPTIKITEDWGRPGSKDRQLIEEFTARIQGDTVEQKLQSLNSILEGQSEPSIGKILSTLVVIEVLNAILAEFTESAGGFIFEGFLAGLFGGQSVQITDVGEQEGDTGATGKPITDVVLGGKEYSLKLLGPGTGVKGSFRNMVEHFKGPDRDHVIYLDARRTDAGLEFGEFIITLENFMEVFQDPFASVKTKIETDLSAVKLKNAIKKISDSKMALKAVQFTGKGFIPGEKSRTFHYSPGQAGISEAQLRGRPLSPEAFDELIQRILDTPSKELEQFGPFKLSYTEAKFGSKSKALFGSFRKAEQIQEAIEAYKKRPSEQTKGFLLGLLEGTPGYTGRQQFEFTRKQAESIAGFKKVGDLAIGEKALKTAWLNYAELLNKTIKPVYGTLNMFKKNVNSYFLGTSTKEKDRKAFGTDAVKDAQNLKTATNKAVTAIEKSEK